MSPPRIPSFNDLPLVKDGPKLNAWGLYGEHDQLGTLNRLTPDIVIAAAKEIQTGHRIGLDWPLDAQSDLIFFGRNAFRQQIIRKSPRVVNDNVWTFNSQGSSQWDGLRHYAYQGAARFYNDVAMEDIHAEGSTVNGVGAWTKQGIVGRGVLLDYHAWRLHRGDDIMKHEAFRSVSIPLADLKAVAEWEGVELKFGDVLFLRSGYMAAHMQMERSELEAYRRNPPARFIGVEQSDEILEWIWENFSAVAGDHPSFECWRKCSCLI